TSIILGLYGKYPFTLGSSEKISLFPLIGFDYEMSITGKIENADGSTYAFDGEGTRPEASALSAAWVKFGGGVDYSLNDNIYIRTEALYGLRGANMFEDDMAKLEKNDGVNAESKSGAGVMIRVGVGYRF
ncbi:MAG: hypothetical protein FWE57_11255, partial [Chitinispirillia bacterium]|nr:hypothetical protein [Chitinispirillia bacterium]